LSKVGSAMAKSKLGGAITERAIGFSRTGAGKWLMDLGTGRRWPKWMNRIKMRPKPSPGYVSKSRLPDDTRTALDGYRNHGWQGNYPGQVKQGVTTADAHKFWRNRRAQLPANPSYHEFDVNVRDIGKKRDGWRFVTDGSGPTWITADHHGTFWRLVP